MSTIREGIAEYESERRHTARAPRFAPAGQSTQMVIGASPESDLQIMRLSNALYHRYALKRVYYSAYVPVNEDSRLPALSTPPLQREHRLYQADWLLRFYGFTPDELLSPDAPWLDSELDPKCSWALRHPGSFPVDVNTAPYEQLLRVLAGLGVVLRRAQFFLTAGGRYLGAGAVTPARLRHCLVTGASPRSVWWQPELPAAPGWTPAAPLSAGPRRADDDRTPASPPGPALAFLDGPPLPNRGHGEGAR
jgi:predicted DNA-binding helix-hairpin-helix protein